MRHLHGLLFGAVASTTLLSAGQSPVVAQSFGESIVIVEGRVLVGESASERTPGAVYVFEERDGRWVEIDALRGPDPRSRDSFRFSARRFGRPPPRR